MSEGASFGTEIYLVVEAVADKADRLAALLGAVNIASVLIRPAGEQVLVAQEAKVLVDLVQAKNVAALIADDAQLARTLRADGVHLSPSAEILPRYQEAREILGQRYVVGAHAGKSRHDAMLLGEAEADYIAFGAPAFAKDRDAARARRNTLVAWWCEIFEVPCVAMDAETPDEVAELAHARADFISIEIPGTVTIADAVTNLQSVAAVLSDVREGAAP